MHNSNIKSISWEEDYIKILDQTRLPAEEVYIECYELERSAKAIEDLSIRGAPAIGVTAAFAMALEAQKINEENYSGFIGRLEIIKQRLLKTRPTAVNLLWALNRMMLKVSKPDDDIIKLKNELKKEALCIYNEDLDINIKIGENAQSVVPDKADIITVCNTGALATAGHGTALGVVRTAVAMGKRIFVAACETRPLLQGARLTSWELKRDNIPFVLITDSMAAYFMRKRGADMVIAGADRIAANGDTANKIGTYSLAVLAKVHKIPFYIAAPVSTIDFSCATGDLIPIEERKPEEITTIKGIAIAPQGTDVWNPAFDVVPAEYISGIITEKGILKAPYEESIRGVRRNSDTSFKIQVKAGKR